MSLISENRDEILHLVLKTEDELYFTSHLIHRIREDIKNFYPTLSPLIDSELFRAYQLIDYAHEQVYKHNIYLNLTYEE